MSFFRGLAMGGFFNYDKSPHNAMGRTDGNFVGCYCNRKNKQDNDLYNDIHVSHTFSFSIMSEHG